MERCSNLSIVCLSCGDILGGGGALLVAVHVREIVAGRAHTKKDVLRIISSTN